MEQEEASQIQKEKLFILRNNYGFQTWANKKPRIPNIPLIKVERKSLTH